MYNNKPTPRIKILYIKELGPSKRNEAALLQSMPWVSEVIIADYRFKVGNDLENASFLQNVYQNWDKNSVEVRDEVCKYINLSADDLVSYYLQQKIDCIFVAGSAYDPSPQYCSETPTRMTPDFRREQFELKLMKAAKNRGIPLLAVCAGSWRLTNAYGAKTFAVPEQDVPQHEQWSTARHPDKLTYLKPGTMLHQIHLAAQRNKAIIFSDGKAQKILGKRSDVNTNFAGQKLNVNSTHWRVSPRPETQVGTEFNKCFETTAIDARFKTVEGYESRYGVPIMGLQFHPEYVIPLVNKKDGSSVIVEDYKTHRSILDSLVESGLTFSRKRQIDSGSLMRQRQALKPPRIAARL